MELEQQVWQTISRYHLLERETTVVVGCSGGPDSVALLLALHALSAAHRLGVQLHVAHVNHMIRGPEAEGDQQLVQHLATSLDLPFHARRVNIPELQQRRRGGLEQVAREARYRCLQQVARHAGATRIAVGHTADDQAETVLHRIVRGAGLRGLSGIPIRRALHTTGIELVRPLLHVSHQEVLRYLQAGRHAYRVDASNHDLELMRNSIRLELLPLLESRYNHQARRSLVRLARVAREACEYLDVAAAAALDELTVSTRQGELCVDCRALLELAAPLQRPVLRLAVRRCKGNLRRITQKHTDRLHQFASHATSGKMLQLPGDLTLLKEYDKLRFRHDNGVAPPTAQLIELAIPGSTPLADLDGEIIAETVPADPAFLLRFRADRTAWEEAMDLDALHLPLHLRRWRAGDRIRPLGAPGQKKLQDLFTDKKVPREQRTAVPVVADRQGRPVWVVGLAIEERVKVREATEHILRLRLVPRRAGIKGIESASVLLGRSAVAPECPRSNADE